MPNIVSDVQPDEALHLGCLLDQTPPDALLCELVFGGSAENQRLPLARLLGMKVPALLVVLDWASVSSDVELRPEVVMAAVELLHAAGTASVLVVSPEVNKEVRNRFFSVFYEGLAAQGGIGAFEAAQEAVNNVLDGRNCFYWYGMPR